MYCAFGMCRSRSGEKALAQQTVQDSSDCRAPFVSRRPATATSASHRSRNVARQGECRNRLFRSAGKPDQLPHDPAGGIGPATHFARPLRRRQAAGDNVPWRLRFAGDGLRQDRVRLTGGRSRPCPCPNILHSGVFPQTRRQYRLSWSGDSFLHCSAHASYPLPAVLKTPFFPCFILEK